MDEVSEEDASLKGVPPFLSMLVQPCFSLLACCSSATGSWLAAVAAVCGAEMFPDLLTCCLWERGRFCLSTLPFIWVCPWKAKKKTCTFLKALEILQSSQAN